MTIYWLTFLFFSLFALIEPRRNFLSSGHIKNYIPLIWYFILIYLVLLIGSRHEVGGDWGSYIKYFDFLGTQNFSEIFSITQDPGYTTLNWLLSSYGQSIYLVNTICGSIFSYGLIKFCRALPRPFLALTAAFPYLILVVAMGYTRQSVAIGLSLLALLHLSRTKYSLFFLMIMIAATFHKTALLLVGILFLASQKNRFLIIILLGIFAAILAQSYLYESYARLIKYYVLEEYASEGAFIRIFMLLIPSILLLTWPHRFNMQTLEKKLWKWISRFSILFFILLLVTDLSTALDRMALYFLPIQLIVFSYLPEFFRSNSGFDKVMIILIVIYFALVQFVWLFFATHALYWLPYQSILLL